MQKTLYFKISLVTIVSILVIMAVQIVAGYRVRLHSYNQELIYTTEQTIGRLEKNIGDFIEVYAVFDYENAIAREMVNADFAAIIIDDQNIAHSFGKQHYTKGKIRNDKNAVVDYDPNSPQHRHLLQGCVYQSERTIQKNGKVIGRIEIYTTNQRLVKALEEFVKVSVIQTLVVCMFLCIILLFSIRKLLTDPIRELSEVAGLIESGDYNARVKVGTKDEIGKLAATFNSMTEKLKQTLENLKKEVEERKLAEEALQNERDLLQTVMDAPRNMHLIYLDNEFNFVRVNETYAATCGYRPAEMVGKNHFALYPDPENEAIFTRVRDTGEPFEVHDKAFQFPDQPGRGVTYWDWTLTPEKGPTGRVVGLIFALVETTERKRAEEQVRFLSSITEFTTDAILVTDTDFTVTYLNKSFEKLFGYSLEDLKGKTPDSLNAEPMSVQIQKELYEAVASGKEFIGESQNRRKDGTTFICEYKVMPFKNQSGQTYAYVGVQRDITARKQAELALQESEQKFRNFAEQSFVGFYIVQDGVFKYVNPKFADIFGYTVEECLDNMQLHQTVHSDDLATVLKQIGRRQEGEVNTVRYRFRGIKKAGEIIHLEVYGASSVYDKKPALIGTILDITKKMEMENRLAQSQRIESIGNLAGGIAHDFNNILFPIVGMSELLIEDLPRQSQQYENAQEILKAGKRGSDLVKQILTFSRQAEHKLVPVRVQQVLKELFQLTRATIPSNIEIKQDIQPDCGMIMADPTQIHQVAMNIMTNAFHAIETTGGAITVNFKETVLNADELVDSVLNPGRYALLSISDTGHGISDDLKARIFEPYFTTKEQGKGTGLGLAVVYGIIKEHKGDIKVYSEVGQGTTFNIYLPLLDRPDDVEIAAPEDYEGGNERILLVDDEEAVVNLEKQMLERLGYHVKSRLNSLEALEAFRTKPYSFDLVISDMTMPNMTGDRLAAEIKSIRPDIPVIICTGFSERMNDQKADVLGIAGILMKPIVKTELAKTVRNVLEETKKDCK